METTTLQKVGSGYASAPIMTHVPLLSDGSTLVMRRLRQYQGRGVDPES